MYHEPELPLTEQISNSAGALMQMLTIGVIVLGVVIVGWSIGTTLLGWIAVPGFIAKYLTILFIAAISLMVALAAIDYAIVTFFAVIAEMVKSMMGSGAVSFGGDDEGTTKVIRVTAPDNVINLFDRAKKTRITEEEDESE